PPPATPRCARRPPAGPRGGPPRRWGPPACGPGEWRARRRRAPGGWSACEPPGARVEGGVTPGGRSTPGGAGRLLEQGELPAVVGVVLQQPAEGDGVGHAGGGALGGPRRLVQAVLGEDFQG